jgi:CubicO group peptidase (beta-lactamase class C family)
MRSLRRFCARALFSIIIIIAASYLFSILPPYSLLSRYLRNMSSAPELLPSTLIADIDRLRREWGIKGAAIMIVKQEKGDRFDQWQKAFVGLGVRDGKGNPMEQDVSHVDCCLKSVGLKKVLQTLFAIASNSKLFTAIALGMIAHDGSLSTTPERFSLQTKVKDVIPEWKLMDPVATEQANFIDVLGECEASTQD